LKSTGRALSYYDHNLLEIDWDAALLIDEPKNFDEGSTYGTGEFQARELGSVRRHPRRPAGPRLPRSALAPEQDRTNRWMLILEILIALLFIIGLVLLFLRLKSPGCRPLTPTDPHPPDSRSDAKMRCWNNQEFIQILFELEAGVM
jgi:hypothetical protein